MGFLHDDDDDDYYIGAAAAAEGSKRWMSHRKVPYHIQKYSLSAKALFQFLLGIDFLFQLLRFNSGNNHTTQKAIIVVDAAATVAQQQQYQQQQQQLHN